MVERFIDTERRRSRSFCDPDAGVAFGRSHELDGARRQNPRNRALTDAVFASFG